MTEAVIFWQTTWHPGHLIAPSPLHLLQLFPWKVNSWLTLAVGKSPEAGLWNKGFQGDLVAKQVVQQASRYNSPLALLRWGAWGGLVVL